MTMQEATLVPFWDRYSDGASDDLIAEAFDAVRAKFFVMLPDHETPPGSIESINVLGRQIDVAVTYGEPELHQLRSSFEEAVLSASKDM